MSSKPKVLIVSVSDDFHAVVIHRMLMDRGADCHILACDRISADHRIHWLSSAGAQGSRLQLPDGERIAVSEIDLIWWRRARSDQKLDRPVDGEQSTLINNECRAALNGLFDVCFQGVWVSSPAATIRAENKMYQLAVAKECGFRTPETLVSQSIVEVTDFADRLHGNIIVKPLVGVVEPLLFTQFIRDPGRFSRESYEICPAIYQEFIPGCEHIRLNCFGNTSYAAVIESSALDWRPNLNVPIRQWMVPMELHVLVRSVLDRLGLAMGVLDLKRTPTGEFVWLEVNPQGQFFGLS